MNAVKPTERKVLGWYAIRRAHVTDWFKERGKRGDRIDSKARSVISSEPQATQRVYQPSMGAGYGNGPKKAPAKAATKEEQKLRDAVHETHKTLATARSVFPFSLFPDTVTIDQHKLTIVYRRFFGIQQSVSVPIENIKNIQADTGPFFGSITITSDHFINNTQTVNWLKRYEAEEIQRLVQGIMVAVKEQIDISKIETGELKGLLKGLGEGRTDKIPNEQA